MKKMYDYLLICALKIFSYSLIYFLHIILDKMLRMRSLYEKEDVCLGLKTQPPWVHVLLFSNQLLVKESCYCFVNKNASRYTNAALWGPDFILLTDQPY